MNSQDIFYMQQLLLDKSDQKKIKKSVIALAGIGGIGSFALEFLIRNGFENFKIADFDVYESNNIRQLYVTQKTIGLKKIDVAVKRALEINPKIKVETYSTGVNINNFNDFCKGSDIICAQTDKITSQILLYFGAQINKLPLLHAGRAKWPHKHLVTLSLYDYRSGSGIFDLKSLGINPSGWGVHKTDQIEKLIENICEGKECEQLMIDIDNENLEYRKESFVKEILTGNTSLISNKDRKYLLEVIKKYPINFYKMAITPELCSISGALIVTNVKNIILNRPIKNMAIDLYNGKLFENYNYK